MDPVSITQELKLAHPWLAFIRSNWKVILGAVFALTGTAAGYAIGIGMSRQERTDDQESRGRLEKNLSAVATTVSELEKHTARIEEHLGYEDQRLNRMESNWDDAAHVVATAPRKRTR